MYLAFIILALLTMSTCRASDEALQSIVKCFDVPCLALILIETNPAFSDKRMRIRSTWLQPAYQQPDLAFVFVMGLMSSPDPLQTEYQKWESQEFGDTKVLNVSEDDVHILDRKVHSMFSWAFETGIRGKKEAAAPRWSYLIKTDDDAVINTFQLRFFLHSPVMLPRKERIYWGRSLFKEGWPTRMHLGMMYLVSMDIAQVLHSKTYEQYESGMDQQIWSYEDLRMAHFVSSIVPQEEWIDALHCELHDFAPDPNVQRTEYQYAISNQTIVVHRVKFQQDFMAAFSTFLPIIEAMKEDCSDIEDEKCQRWNVRGDQGCLVAPGLDLVPPDASMTSVYAVCVLSVFVVAVPFWIKNRYAETSIPIRTMQD